MVSTSIVVAWMLADDVFEPILQEARGQQHTLMMLRQEHMVTCTIRKWDADKICRQGKASKYSDDALPTTSLSAR
jgi:hypothetical protein